LLGLAGKKDKSIPVRRVINAAIHAQAVEVHFVARKKGKGKMSLVKMGGQVKQGDVESAKEWVDALLATAYRGKCSLSPFPLFYTLLMLHTIPSGSKRHKKLRILINPFGGTVSMWYSRTHISSHVCAYIGQSRVYLS
jgi:hypothetical protein